MVVLLSSEQRESESPLVCARDKCKSTGNMLKCSSESCDKYFHVTCTKFKTDDEALAAPDFFCSSQCKPKQPPKNIPPPMKAVEPTKDQDKSNEICEKLETKIQAQKSTILMLSKKIESAGKANEQLQAKLYALENKVAKLEGENKRIPILEHEIAELKNNSVVFLGESSKSNVKAKLVPEKTEEQVLEDLFSVEDDDDFKRRLTQIFCNSAQGKCDNESQNKARKSTVDVDAMNETQKLAYYQRLHVQRMEAPKLMKYEGDPAQWISFKANYERMKEKGEYDNESMIEKLRESLCGEAETFVRQRLNQPYANADNIMEVLKRKFFQPKEAIANSLAKLESWHQIPDKNRKELEAFLFELDNYIYLCENLGFKPELEVAINSRITSKLPYNVETRWCNHIDEKKIKGTIKDLSDFMWSFVPNLPIRQTDVVKVDNTKKFRATVQMVQPGESSKSFSSKKNKRDKFPPCWYCGNDKRHYLSRCEDFRKLSFEEKAKFLSNNKICIRCLSSNQHTNANCPSTKMLKCSRPNCSDSHSHCTLMHPPGESTNKPKPSPKPALHVNPHSTMLFRIVPIYVIDAFGRKVETTLLMDGGAGASLVSKCLFDKLSIKGEKCRLELTWLRPDEAYNEDNAILHDLTIALKHDPTKLIKFSEMYAIEDLILPEQEQDPEKIKEAYPIMREAEIPAFKRQRPQILLGLRHKKWMVSLETVMDFAKDDTPIAERTPLGWTICGGLTPHMSIFHACEVPENECFHNENNDDETESLEKLHELVKRMNSFEMLGLTDPNKKFLCKNDERAMEIQNRTMKLVDGRYEIGLYWNDDKCTLPDNYNTALKRLKSSEARLKQLGMVQWANEHHKLLRDMGFVREANADDLNPVVPHKRINYVIGFVTFNMNKEPPKPRWVVDTASKHNGASLNSVLLKGPDNLIPLTQALFHFRERKVAMVSDVTKMYHQVRIRDEDQQAQRFLWRDCDGNKEPTIFIFQCMLFGPTCSPSQANAIRIDHATNSSKKFPGASRVAMNSMYMDDAFNSEDTEEEAVKVAIETIEMFKEINWEMVSFRSNSSTALKKLPVGNVDDKLLVDLCSEDDIMSQKVLGLAWDIRRDIFMFKTMENHQLISLSLHENYHPTKKEILSFVMKIFDCLGLISHFHIRGRMILQAIWRRGIGWNQHIPDDIHESWKLWLEKFDEIGRLEIPRHYGYDSRYSRDLALHVFVDASMEAYAAVAYFRFKNHDKIHVAQVMSKCRVAPVKYASVPKLELMAALVGARIMNNVKEQHHRLRIESITFWTDSVTVLRWLYSRHIRLQQFVAPRISEIQETTNINDWRYVPTNENVADDGTKWNDIDFSSPAQRWLKRPDFLYKPEEEWPAKFPLNVEIVERPILVVSKGNRNMYYAGVFEKISPKSRANWKIYRSIVGWIMRFKTNGVSRIRGTKKITSSFLDANELHYAEDVIIKQIQKEVFADELIDLTRGRGVKQSSKLYSLNSFMDGNGIIRARTRMYMEDSIPYDMRCPPILPNKHETVHAFLQYLHIKNKHIGIETTIAEARSRAWIIHARKAVKRVKHQCLFCIEIRARHQTPGFAPLPSYRLDSKSQPFEHCGVDCCGPFTIYTGLSRHKREVHVVIFTCMITRAVYLRKLDHMSADEMLLAIQDVWTRRGPIRHMYSDNGRNFLGVSNIIKDEHHRQLAAEKQMKWHFSPALTPHWGGVWERLIKDIKRAMKAEMNNRVLPEKVFECALLQIEDIMNNRPLTHIPVSPDDYAPLTPNFMIKLHPSYSFVGGDLKPDDDDSRYYTRRARKVSMKLMEKWLKQYLPIITKQNKPKKPGEGLKINDIVIYTDPTVKPAEWQRGMVINVYTGRDGIARVADIKLKNGNIVEKRSVTRLAKLEIDNGSFEFEKSSKDANNQSPLNFTPLSSEHKQSSHDSEKINILFSYRKQFIMERISKESLNRLTVELGDAEFFGISDYYSSHRGYIEDFRILTTYERFEDPQNVKTFKIHRIPPNCSIQELIVALTKLNWWCTRIVVDSISQTPGFFAFVTLDNEKDTETAINAGIIQLLGRDCKISKAQTASPTIQRQGYEFATIFWRRDRNMSQQVILVRRRDTANVSHAVPCLNDECYRDYLRLKVEGDPLRMPLPPISRKPKVRSVIYVPDQMPGKNLDPKTQSVVFVPTGLTESTSKPNKESK